jgi:hypothetical protein
MAVLTQKMKKFVVVALASGDGVTEVARNLKETFGVEVSLPALLKYHPLRATGASLSPELEKLFHETRARAVDEMHNTDLAHVAVRLRRLDALYDEAMSKGQLKAAVTVLTEARKIMDNFIEVDEPGEDK